MAAPAAVTGVSATRVNDSTISVSWTNHPTSAAPYSSIAVTVATDTGSYAQVATLSGTASNYSWHGATANHRYSVRVRPSNSDGPASWATSGYVYTTPAAPTGIELQRPTGDNVVVTVTSTAMWNTTTEVEATTDGGVTWSSVGVISGSGSGAVIDTQSRADTVQYRARSVRGSLVSAWKLSSELSPLTMPYAPTLTTSGGVVVAGSAVTFGWIPNHPDASAQTKAQVKLNVGGVSSTVTINDDTTTYDLTSDLATPVTVAAQVRTQGGEVGVWGPWSNVARFKAYDAPVVTIDSPATDGAVVTALPATISWTATDSTGIADVALALYDSDGVQLRRWELAGSATSFDLDRTTYFLTNGESYSVGVTVQAGSTLQATATRVFSIDYLGPAKPTADIVWDEDALACAVTVGEGESPVAPTTILGVGAGTAVEVTDGTLHTLSVDGKSVQDGTPTPLAPVAIQSVAAGQLIVDPEAASGWQSQGGSSVAAYTDETVGACLKFTQAGGGSSYRLQTQSSNFVHVSGTTYALGFWARASASTTIYASCGTSTNTNVNYVNGESVGTEWTYFSGDGTANGAYRLTFWAAAAVTLYIWHPMLVLGSTVAKYATMGNIGIATSWDGSTTLIDLQGHELRSLPDGTKDELHVDSAGNVTLTQRVGHTTTAETDGITGTVGEDVMSSSGTIADGYDVLYPLATPQTTSLGTITMPTVEDGDTVEVVGSSVVPSIGATWALASDDGWATVHDGMTIGTDAATLTASTDYTLLVESDGAVTLEVADEPMAQPFEDSTVGVSVSETRATLTTKADATNDLSMQFDVTGDARLRLALYPDGYAGAWQEYSSVPRPHPTSFYVVRVMPDGSEWLVAEGLASGEQALDMLPPLGVEFSYRVVAVASSGTETPTLAETSYDTNAWAFGFGQGVAETLLLIADPAASSSWEHGGESYHFADGTGDGLPLWYGTDTLDVSHSWSFAIPKKWTDVAEDAQRMFRKYATCWVRDPFGHRWHVMAKASVGVKPGPKWTVSVSATELRFEEA